MAKLEPHWFETAIGDARLWGVVAVIGLAIAFSRRASNSDFAVWTLLTMAAAMVILIVNTHRRIRSNKYRPLLTAITTILMLPILIVSGQWLTTPIESAYRGTSATDMLRATMALLWHLRWRWIVPSVAVGVCTTIVVISLLARRRRRSLCPNKQLHVVAERDKSNISELVKVFAINAQGGIIKDGPTPHIDFRFAIYNMALHQVSIDKAVSGSVTFWKDGFRGSGTTLRREPTIEENLATNCLFRDASYFTLRQDLTLDEAAYIASAPTDSFFWFSAVTITITGNGLSSTPLEIKNLRVNKDSRYWADTPEYIFAGDDDKAKPILGPRLTHQELLQRIEALPPDERVIAHKLALDMYGASLYRNGLPKKR